MTTTTPFEQVELPKELTGTSVAILLFLNSVVCNIGPWFITWQDDGLATVNRPLFAVVSNDSISGVVYLFGTSVSFRE